MIERVDPKTNAKIKMTNFTPADYEKEIQFRTEEELRKEINKEIGQTDDVPFKQPGGTGGTTDYSKEL